MDSGYYGEPVMMRNVPRRLLHQPAGHYRAGRLRVCTEADVDVSREDLLLLCRSRGMRESQVGKLAGVTDLDALRGRVSLRARVGLGFCTCLRAHARRLLTRAYGCGCCRCSSR